MYGSRIRDFFTCENEVIPALGLLWILSGPSCELWDISQQPRDSCAIKILDPFKLVNRLLCDFFMMMMIFECVITLWFEYVVVVNYDIYLNNQEIYASKTSSKASGFRFVIFFDDDDDFWMRYHSNYFVWWVVDGSILLLYPRDEKSCSSLGLRTLSDPRSL